MNATQQAGGILTLEDMQSYKALIREPVTTYYHGRKVTTCNTPTSGPLVASVLNLLELYNIRVEGFTGLNVHRFVEALKYGFAFRTEFGDPDYTLNMDRIDEFVTKTYASLIRQNITDVSRSTSSRAFKSILRCIWRQGHYTSTIVLQPKV